MQRQYVPSASLRQLLAADLLGQRGAYRHEDDKAWHVPSPASHTLEQAAAAAFLLLLRCIEVDLLDRASLHACNLHLQLANFETDDLLTAVVLHGVMLQS